MTKTLKLRKALNDAAATSPVDGKKAYKLSVNDFIVKAVGCALQRVPEANSQWLETEGVLRLYSYVDISVYSLSCVGFLHGLCSPSSTTLVAVRHSQIVTSVGL